MEVEFFEILKLFLDTGLLVVVWIVQLIIYPSFNYYTHNNLKIWHSNYTGKITIIVFPLMISQLILAIWLILSDKTDLFNLINIVLVALTWISTFLIFVPLHNKIDIRDSNLETYVEKLVRLNWIRTALWTAIFILNVFFLIN